jgi:hypothetical protein
MKDEDVKILSEFLQYFQKETDRGAALVGAAMIESRLERLLDLTLINNSSKKDVFEGPNSVLGNFSSKIKMSHLLGYITDKEAREINLIRKIRNEFAHNLEEIKFNTQPVSDYCMQLEADTPGDFKKDKNHRGLFINSVALVSLALWYRPEYVLKKNKLVITSWENEL